MKHLKQFLMIALAAGFLFSANVQAKNRVVVIKKRPPVVKVEVKKRKPFRNALWVTGHWKWKNNQFVWVKGKWVKPRRGYVWIPGHWKETRHGYVRVDGRWKRV